jgi:hypothetical protein
MKYCLPTSDLLSKFAIFYLQLSEDNHRKFIFLIRVSQLAKSYLVIKLYFAVRKNYFLF